METPGSQLGHPPRRLDGRRLVRRDRLRQLAAHAAQLLRVRLPASVAPQYFLTRTDVT
jgi:hypothetical protein